MPKNAPRSKRLLCVSSSPPCAPDQVGSARKLGLLGASGALPRGSAPLCTALTRPEAIRHTGDLPLEEQEVPYRDSWAGFGSCIAGRVR